MNSVDISELCSKVFLDNLSRHKGDIGLTRLLKDAKKNGLSSEHILVVVDGIQSDNISIEDKLELMKCLIPLKDIPVDAFIKLSGILSSFKFCTELKVEILKWMISTYPFLEKTNLKRFLMLYELFLQLLKEETLMPYVCHLLCLITDGNDVTSRRVDFVRKMKGSYGYEPCLDLLLIKYYEHCPASFDEDINVNCEYEVPSLGIYPDLIKHVHPSHEFNVELCFSTCDDNLSDSRTSSSSDGSFSSVSCDESRTFPKFRVLYKEFVKLQKSTSISKILDSEYIRLLLTSDIPIKTKIKIYDYIVTSLFDYDNFNSSDYLRKILHLFQDIEHAMVNLSDFTEMLISSWDGTSNLDIICGFLQYEPICCFGKIAYKMERICEIISNANEPIIKCELLYCVSKMYENWVLMQYDRFSCIPCYGKCSNPEDESAGEPHKPKDEIAKLAAYINSICDSLIASDLFLPCMLNEILLHYERISIIHKEMDDLTVCVPTEAVFHAALFSFSCLTLDNLGQLMLRYNDEIEQMQMKKNEEAELATKYFYQCSHDIHNFLKFERHEKNKNTYLSKTNAFRRLKKEFPRFQDLLMYFRHPAILMIFVHCRKYVEAQKKKDSGEYMSLVLKYLSENGLEQLINFIKL